MRFTWWTLASAAVVLAAPAPQAPGQTPTPTSSGTPTTPSAPNGTVPSGNAQACAQIQPKVQQFLMASPKGTLREEHAMLGEEDSNYYSGERERFPKILCESVGRHGVKQT